MAMVARPPKGKAYERKMGDRCVLAQASAAAMRLHWRFRFLHRIAKIQASLADMDKKIADYKKVRGGVGAEVAPRTPACCRSPAHARPRRTR